MLCVAVTDGKCCAWIVTVGSVVCGYNQWTMLCVAITGGQCCVWLSQVDSVVYVDITGGQCCVGGYHR